MTSLQGLVGKRLPAITAIVAPGRLRHFRRIVGSADPDEARAPPTYLFALEMLESARPMAFVEELGVDIATVLHSEQAFTYHGPVYAGDTITLETQIADIFEKKAGALVFVVQDTRATNQHDRIVADIRRTLVIRRKSQRAG